MPYASRSAQGTTQVGRRDFVLAMSGTAVASCIQSRECGGILALPLSRSARDFPLQERPASAGFSFRSTRFAGRWFCACPRVATYRKLAAVDVSFCGHLRNIHSVHSRQNQEVEGKTHPPCGGLRTLLSFTAHITVTPCAR